MLLSYSNAPRQFVALVDEIIVSTAPRDLDLSIIPGFTQGHLSFKVPFHVTEQELGLAYMWCRVLLLPSFLERRSQFYIK